MQVDPIQPTLKPTGTKRLKLQYDETLSKFAFKFNSHRYSKEPVFAAASVSHGVLLRRRGSGR